MPRLSGPYEIITVRGNIDTIPENDMKNTIIIGRASHAYSLNKFHRSSAKDDKILKNDSRLK